MQLRALWIDDNEQILSWGQNVFSAEGLDLQTASTGEAGLSLASRHAHDVLILDWILPDLDGATVLSTLRHRGLLRPAIVLSAYLVEDDLPSLVSLGAAALCHKPIRARRLLDVVYRTALLGRSNPIGSTDEQAGSWCSHTLALHSAQTTAQADHQIRALRHWLAVSSVHRHLTVPEVLLFARLFRLLGHPDNDALNEVRRQLEACVQPLSHVPSAVGRAMARFEAGGREVYRLRESAVAREFAIDPAHFGRLIRHYTGLTFRTWRLGARFRQVLRELGQGRDQLGVVATRCGWSSYRLFSRQFRRHFGVGPREAEVLLRNWSRNI